MAKTEIELIKYSVSFAVSAELTEDLNDFEVFHLFDDLKSKLDFTIRLQLFKEFIDDKMIGQ